MAFFRNEKVVNFLEKFLTAETNEIQSLLFYGEDGVGKRTTALAFAKALLCQTEPKQLNGCNQCQSCSLFDKGLHPDFLFLDPLIDNLKPNEKQDLLDINEKDENIYFRIETIRKAIEFLHYKPQLSKLKILIINEADKLKEDSQNTLLKTLEEPPSNTLIILITAFPQKLLPTVFSRLLPLRFSRIATDKIADFLMKERSLDINQAQKIAAQAGGKIGLALKLLDKTYEEERKKSQKLLLAILKSNFRERYNYLKELTANKHQLLKTLKIWLELLDQEIKTSSLSPSYLQLTKELLQAFNVISNYNINSTLLLENIFLKYSKYGSK